MNDKKNNQNKMIGKTLFFVGAVVAISAAAKMPNSGDDYPTTTATVVIALILGVIGNIIWHRTEKIAVLAMLEKHKGDDSHNPVLLLEKTIPALESLYQKVDSGSLKGMELCTEIDDVLNQFIHPFTEKRKTFMDMLGQAKGSEILLMIAYAERMLNRTWSASSDGHAPEALSSLKDSVESYRAALVKC